MKINSDTGEILEEIYRCIFCGEFSSDWWCCDRGNSTCRCRDCYSKGISETSEEKRKYSASRFNPVINRDFTPEILQEKKPAQVEVEESFHFLRFAPEGSLVEFSPRIPVKNRRPSVRGDVEGFSVRSRSRLNKKIAMLQCGVFPLFVTLTYHQQIPETFEGYKSHLDTFFKSLFRKFPNAGIMWKLEFQERGYAHYHLFVWNVALADLQDFVPEVWHRIAGYNSNYHLAWHRGELGNKNEHCVEPIRSWNGVRFYASKYFAKLDDDKTRGGRVWGMAGSHLVMTDKKNADGSVKYKRVSNIPFSRILEFRVSLTVALEFRQSMIEKFNYEFQRLGFWTHDFSADLLAWFYELQNAFDVLNAVPEDPPDWDLDDFPNDEDNDKDEIFNMVESFINS